MTHQPVEAAGHQRCTARQCETCNLRPLTFCSELPSQDLSRLAAIVRQSHVAPHQLLFQEGDAADEVFNLVEGTVKLYKSLPDGRTQIIGFLFAGDFMGLASHGTYAYSAEALTDVKLCRFRQRELTALFREYPKLVDRMLAIASDELALAQEQMLLLGRKTAQEKLVSFLLAMSDRAKRRGQAGDVLNLPMTRVEIADYLGLTIETVSRTITKLRELGVIRLPRPHDVILSGNGTLRALAGTA